MPRFPAIAPSAQSVRGGVYSGLTRRPASGREPIPLHIGDTWLPPADGCRMQDFSIKDYPGMHCYSPVPGYPQLRARIAEHHAKRCGVETSAEQVLVTAGATAGLAAAVGALIAPGDEVLLSAPYWPLIAGSVQAFHAQPVAVPVIGTAQDADQAAACLAEHANSKTAAVYWNTPNNPTGKVIPRDWLEVMIEWAREQQLWIFSDEVYEDYVYQGEHVYTRQLAPERTISAHSFSKAYGMAGNRVGYLVGPQEAIAAIERVMTNIAYSACSTSQLAAMAALDKAEPWLDSARQQYAGLGRQAAETLGVAPPQGGTFLFLDVSAQLDKRGLDGWLGDVAEAGVLLAPGPSFGPYPHHARLCFTATEPARVREGVAIVARFLS